MPGLIIVALLAFTGCAHSTATTPGLPAPMSKRTTSADGTKAHSGPSLLAPVYSKALEGNVREALLVLERVPVESLDASERSARECLLQTFAEKKLAPMEAHDPFVADLISIYREYWMRVLLQELSASDGETYLFQRLSAFLGTAGHRAKYDSLDDLVDELGSLLLQKGLHSIRGITRPYYELMVWRKETARTYDVNLPEMTIPVKVIFMQDFAVLGWSAFATCGKAYSGGWAKEDSLYCVAESYDTSSETFSISYLAHESQHFADYRRFPKLEQPELEYRAKLVELSQAKETARALVIRFALRTGKSRSAPHNFANLKVIADLSRSVFGSDSLVADEKRWATVSVNDINSAATALLKRNTEKLVSLGATTVSRVLE
jgi:hypothetical protein